jgi:hypothetical protein
VRVNIQFERGQYTAGNAIAAACDGIRYGRSAGSGLNLPDLSLPSARQVERRRASAGVPRAPTKPACERLDSSVRTEQRR